MKFRKLLEGIKKLSDTTMDKELMGKNMLTFEYNDKAIMDFAKTTTVRVTQDKKYFHIVNPADDKVVLKSIEKKIKQYNLKEIKWVSKNI